MSSTKTFKEQVTVGSIIFHSPRNHYYTVLNKTSIKIHADRRRCGESTWLEGLIYTEVSKTGEGDFVWCSSKKKPNYFSRPLDLFDSDWLFIR